MNAEQLEQHLKSQLEGCEIKVESEGAHFVIHACGKIFEELSTLKKQQLVYACVTDQIANGDIHALTIRATAPQTTKD